MRQSGLFTKTRKEAPKDEVSKNAQLLIRAGYIHKEMAGVYTFLPLGLVVIEKITQIIREELNKAGCHEIKMTALQQKDTWEKSDRWRDDLDDGIWFKTKLNGGSELGLAFTHEEALTNIMKNFVSSYKDLPVYAYQFQTKFRNELRAKSGLMRGREFIMKDLYDFSVDENAHKEFYEKMKVVYTEIFNRVGIGDRTFLTLSSGGSFSKYSYEFQTLSDAGEDILVFDKEKGLAVNKDDFNDEIFEDFNLNKDDYNFEEAKSVEVGDIYSLGEKFSKALNLTYKDASGEQKYPYMGSYGIGVPRVMGALVEIFSDEKGIVWPASVAPFKLHIVTLGNSQRVTSAGDALYSELTDKGIEVLYDDRKVGAGEKFADSDLIGIPYRVVISEKTLEAGNVELVERSTGETRMVEESELTSL